MYQNVWDRLGGINNGPHSYVTEPLSYIPGVGRGHKYYTTIIVGDMKGLHRGIVGKVVMYAAN